MLTGQVTTTPGNTLRARVSIIEGSTTFAGQIDKGIHLWGAMLHEGGPAPYWATPTAATVSKQLCGPGTLVVECTLPNGMQSSQPLVAMNDGAINDNNAIILRVNAGASGVVGVNKISAVQDNTNATVPLSPSNWLKAALAWDEAGYSICVDGQTVQSKTPPWPMFAFSRMAIGRLPAAGFFYLNGPLHRVTYRPSRLPASVLQALTAP